MSTTIFFAALPTGTALPLLNSIMIACDGCEGHQAEQTISEELPSKVAVPRAFWRH